MCDSHKDSYCGKSFHHVFSRAAELMVISNLTGKRLESIKQSATFDRLLEGNCSIDFGYFGQKAPSNHFR